jgi:hypothetical protein
MRKVIGLAALMLATIPGAGPVARAASTDTPCSREAGGHLPARPARALGASDFVRRISGASDEERETAFRDQLAMGNVPHFLRTLLPVVLTGSTAAGQPVSVLLCVAPDYLALGSDDDFLFVPLRLATALSIAGRFGFVLPTPRIADAIHAQARTQLVPQPLPAGNTMRSTPYYWRHTELILEQRAAASLPLGTLTAGDKKDLVLTNRLWRSLGRVAIYGWHQPDGQVIQPLSTLHGARYADYSHGVRLVSAVAFVKGEARSIVQLLQDPMMAGVLNDEGAIPELAALLRTLKERPAHLARR